MSYSALRIFCGLVISVPLAACVALLAWGIHSEVQYAYIFNFGILFVAIMLSLVLIQSFIRFAQAEQNDFNQKKIDIIFSTLKYLDGNKPESQNPESQIDIESIEFDYFPTQKPDNFDQGSIQL